MMKQEHAHIVEKSLPLTNTKKLNAAQRLVQIDFTQDCLNFAKVKAIRYLGRQDVYNMEVKDHHNFSVNGGLIVHNSIDSVRYSLENEMNYNRIEFLT